MQKPVEKPIKFKKNAATFGKTYPITHIEAVVDGNGKTLPDLLEQMQSTIPSTSGDVMSYTDSEGNTRYIASTDDPSGIVGGGGNMTEITRQELKNKRNAGELTPGSLYRITDYNCTTTQENTQSAGHQFDIVLLALGANKLAEEGWAMMHDNIYDVTFSDGVTKKCYIYFQSSDSVNVVILDTLLGSQGLGPDGDIFIKEDDKTATVEFPITYLDEENVPYNYFQNSNLSAWKVWYCLDNDADRFAWADDSLDISRAAYITVNIAGQSLPAYRNTNLDTSNFYGWESRTHDFWTNSEDPQVGDTIYNSNGVATEFLVESFTPQYEGTNLPNGRGVIFRLIDEWNNDCPYDFKNIQFLRPLTDGMYDEDGGTNTWCYTTGETALDIDLSIWHYPTHDLYISSILDIDLEEDTSKYFLPDNVFLIPTSSKLYNTTKCTMMGAPLEMRNCRNVVLGDGVNAGVYINCFGMSDTDDEKATFYFNNGEVISGTSGSGDSGDDTTSR